MPTNDHYSPTEKAQCVLLYAQFQQLDKARRVFYRQNGMKKAPSRKSIQRWHDQFQRTGLLKSSKKGRKLTATVTVEAVRTLFETKPKTSLREAEKLFPICKSTVRNILKKRLKFYPYKIQRLHALRTADYGKRKDFAVTVLGRIQARPEYLNNICFTDESTFHTSGYVHKHNCRIWGREKPKEIRQVERASPKVNVWCGLMVNKIIGPFFLEDKNVNQQNFLQMLQSKIVPELQERQPRVLFQLDGAPPHWGLRVRKALDDEFPNRWIGRDGPTPWPARSPDITPLDFFLWGYVKTKVFKSEIKDIDDLKTKITEAVASVRPEMLVNTWKEVKSRLEMLAENGGRHVEG